MTELPPGFADTEEQKAAEAGEVTEEQADFNKQMKEEIAKKEAEQENGTGGGLLERIKRNKAKKEGQD